MCRLAVGERASRKKVKRNPTEASYTSAASIGRARWGRDATLFRMCYGRLKGNRCKMIGADLNKDNFRVNKHLTMAHTKGPAEGEGNAFAFFFTIPTLGPRRVASMHNTIRWSENLFFFHVRFVVVVVLCLGSRRRRCRFFLLLLVFQHSTLWLLRRMQSIYTIFVRLNEPNATVAKHKRMLCAWKSKEFSFEQTTCVFCAGSGRWKPKNSHCEIETVWKGS